MEDYLSKRQYGPKYQDELVSSFEDARSVIAALINALSDEIAFAENTATGISIAVNGLPLKPSDEAVLTDMEYPANVYPWLNLAQKGVKVHIVPHRRGGLDVDRLMAAVTEHTKVVAVSSGSHPHGCQGLSD